jgi:luciferase family oxidoreductase group 1
MNTPIISALDFVSMREGESAGKAIARAVKVSQAVEKLGYHRIWYSEHHGVSAVASASPALLIGHVAAATQSIRVGAGGVMLLNHPPMIIAEQFGTLEALFPGRIDLGLGRAVGSTKIREEITKKALRRDPRITDDDFPELLAELQLFLGPGEEDQEVKAYPGQGSNVPLFLLSSSGHNARLAGELGLPFIFAAHIAPANLMSSIELYRQHFRPSSTLDRPYVMISVFALAAETDEEARKFLTFIQQFYLSAVGGTGRAIKPVDSMDGLWTEEEKEAIEKRMQFAITGGRGTVSQALRSFIEQTGADELFFWTDTYKDEDRLRSYAILHETVSSRKGAV